MFIIGIHDGHNCGASLFKNGKLLIAVNEEKITRKKNEYGFPKESILLCLKKFNLKKKDISYVAVSTKNLPPKYFIVKGIQHLILMIISRTKFVVPKI